jgi:hypothetical protein
MRLLVLLVLTLTACPEKQKKKLSTAEVEFLGSWNAGDVKFATATFVAQREPCVPVPEKPTRFGEMKMGAPGPLFAEFFITQGETGHACLYAFDEAGKVVGVASSKQNPLKFEGAGEVMFSKLDFALQAP